MDGEAREDPSKEAKAGPQWHDVVLDDEILITAQHQRTFRGFAEQAHTVGVSVNNDVECSLLQHYSTSCRDYFVDEGYCDDDVAAIRAALVSFELLAAGLPKSSPMNHLSRVRNDKTGAEEYMDTTLAALDPSFDESGLAADLVAILRQDRKRRSDPSWDRSDG